MSFGGVGDGDGDDVVSSCEGGESAFVAVVLEIGEDEDGGSPSEDASEVVEGVGDGGLRALWLEGEDVADDAEGAGGALEWGDDVFEMVGEDGESDLVVGLGGGECEHGGEFGGEVVLGAFGGAERAGGGEVDGEEDGSFALFAEAFDEGSSLSCGDVPVEGLDVVAGLVFADLLEFHAGAAEGAGVVAGDEAVDGASGMELDEADFSGQFGGCHGTRTLSRIFWTMWSGEMSSASAS